MPKLDDVKLGVSVLTDTVMMGTIKDASTWKEKRDCTSDFCSALLTWIPPGNVREIGSSTGKRYEIEVRELAPNAELWGEEPIGGASRTNAVLGAAVPPAQAFSKD